MDAAFDDETKNFITDYEPIMRSLQHRDLQQETSTSIKFKKALEEKQSVLRKKYPFVSF
jgi:hypothetical protein